MQKIKISKKRNKDGKTNTGIKMINKTKLLIIKTNDDERINKSAIQLGQYINNFKLNLIKTDNILNN